MEYRILGPLVVVRDGRPVAVDASKQRTLLAVLLLHANEVVSSDRLVDELWGERPPATALKTLQVYVSQLRKLVGGDTIVTRGRGYAALLDADQLDLARFRRLVADAHRLAEAQRPAEAAEAYRRALSLWRGDALSDVAMASVGRQEVDRLDELRVTVIEDRIDCELALGRHELLVEELDELVGKHPYRERLRAQLMLALYRSGRQADALAAYRSARRRLSDELGIEPGEDLRRLEQAILRHDESLDPPTPRAPPGRSRRRRGHRPALVVVAAAAVVLVTIAAAAALSLRDSPAVAHRQAPLTGNSVVVVDPATNEVVGEIPVGGRPSGIAVAAGSVWVGNRDAKTLLRIDPRKRQVVRTIGLGAVPDDVAVGDGDVWVALDQAELLRIDPAINDVVAKIRVSSGKNLCCYPKLEFGGGAMWLSDLGSLWRIDVATHAVTRVRGAAVYTIAYGERGLWAITGVEGDWIERIDPRTTAVVERFRLNRVGRTRSLGPLGIGAGALWTAAHRDTTVLKTDPATGRVTGTVEVGHAVGAGFTTQPTAPVTTAVAGETGVWFTTSDARLVRIHPVRLTVAATIQLDVYPGPMAVAEGAVWVTTTAP